MSHSTYVKMELNIDPEFDALIPPLSPEERAQLEANILADGCREPLTVTEFDGSKLTIVDGHNRYRICQQHDLPFQVSTKYFPSREAVKVWILQNQLGRRNLTPFARAEMALKLKGSIAAIAHQNMSAGGKGVANLPKVRTRQVIADMADTSERNVAKVETIVKDAPDYVRKAARAGEVSIDKAHRVTLALEGAPLPIQQLAVQHQLFDDRAIETWKKADPRMVQEALERGYVMGVDGEDVAVADADPTLVQATSDEEVLERLKRQQQHIDDNYRIRAERETGEAVKITCPMCGVPRWIPVPSPKTDEKAPFSNEDAGQVSSTT